MLRRRLFAEACAFAGEEIRNPDRLRMWIRYAHYFKYKTARSAAFSCFSEGRSRGGYVEISVQCVKTGVQYVNCIMQKWVNA